MQAWRLLLLLGLLFASACAPARNETPGMRGSACTRFRLTASECANAGTHRYRIRKSPTASCATAFDYWLRGDLLTITVEFEPAAVSVLPAWPVRFEQQGTNRYVREQDGQLVPEGTPIHHNMALTFSASGFTVHYTYLLDGKSTDCWTVDFQRAD